LERKGSTTSNKPPAYLLRLFGIHQRLNRYIPRFDYISRSSNHIADALSRQFEKPWSHLIASLSSYLPQQLGCQRWTPSKPIVSAVTSALLTLPFCRESLQDVPLAMPLLGEVGSPSPVTWASTPFSKPSKTKYLSYKSLANEFVLENLHYPTSPRFQHNKSCHSFSLNRMHPRIRHLPWSITWIPSSETLPWLINGTFENNWACPWAKLIYRLCHSRYVFLYIDDVTSTVWLFHQKSPSDFAGHLFRFGHLLVVLRIATVCPIFCLFMSQAHSPSLFISVNYT